MGGRARLVRNLRRLGVLRSQRIEDALTSLDEAAWTPDPLRPFAYLDVPWPEPDGRRFSLTPRLTTLLAELLEPEPGSRVLLTPRAPGLLAALLTAAGARIAEPGGDDPVDRAVVLDGDWDLEDAARRRVADGGFLLRVRLDAFGEDLVKEVRDGAAWIRLGLRGLRLDPQESVRPGHTAYGEPLGHVLALEGTQRRVWTDRHERPEDRHFAQTVERTWAPTPRRGDRPEHLLLARKLFHLGVVAHGAGDLVSATELYTASIQTRATAEAHTFLAWIDAMLGDLDRAIGGCKQAIAVDPNFGNPYNDIGAYLLEQGRAEQALHWLERAKHAPRYEAPHFAFTNAGRAHLMLGDPRGARRELKRALHLEPGYEPARRLLEMTGTSE